MSIKHAAGEGPALDETLPLGQDFYRWSTAPGPRKSPKRWRGSGTMKAGLLPQWSVPVGCMGHEIG